MGSSRFPGKMAADLAGYPVIDWVMTRSKQSQLLEKIILATSTLPENDYLIDRAKHNSISSYRGSENNVLSRFIDVARKENANVIARICADNPFISGSEIDRIIDVFLREKPDYAFNHIPSMGNDYVDGIGIEIISLEALNIIAKKAVSAIHLEHVTKYLWDNKNNFNIQTIKAPIELAFPNLSLDVDTKEDLLYLNKLLNEAQSWRTPEDVSIRDIVRIARLIK